MSAARGLRGAENAREFVALDMTREEAPEAGRRANAFVADFADKASPHVCLPAGVGARIEKDSPHQGGASDLREIHEEKQRLEELLHKILPEDVAVQLKLTGRVQPRRYEDVGVLFCDIVEFTSYCDQHPAEQVVENLQAMVETFEEISERHGLEKIKTIGDAFMGTIGLHTPAVNAALSCVSCGLEMVDAAARLPPFWKVQVGIQVGPVIAGVVGRRKYQYDIWGDTVNMAARMASCGKPGCVCVGAETWRLLGGHPQGRPMGRIEIRGKGSLEVFVIGDKVG